MILREKVESFKSPELQVFIVHVTVVVWGNFLPQFICWINSLTRLLCCTFVKLKSFNLFFASQKLFTSFL